MSDKADLKAENRADSESDRLIGATVSEYKIKALVGIGGMARVYEAYDEKLDRRVALKLMAAQHNTDQEMAQRFWREARTLASLDHPHIVSLYHIGEINQAYYIAMKFIDGKTLLTILKKLRQQKKFMEPERVVSIMADVASALDYAHNKGVIHRDIKPSNIMLTKDGRGILTDFGLTMQVSAESTMGTAFGTPRYIAPEQAISSHRAVPQSDIYSLGVVIYEMITGQAPFDNDSPMSLALSHITNPPPPPRTVRADIPLEVQDVILKALEKKPEDRYQTASAMVNALRAAYGLAPGEPLPDVPALDPPKIAAANQPLMPDRAALKPEPAAAKPKRKYSLARYAAYAAVTLLVSLLGGLAAVWLLNLQSASQRVSVDALSTAAPLPPRLRLIYSKDWFAIFNPTGKTVSLRGISFTRGESTDNRVFEPVRYLSETAVNSLADGQCLRIRLDRTDDRSAPVFCGPQNRVGVITDPTARFWLAQSDKDATFVVKRDQTVLQTCLLWLTTCEFSLP